jgi:hypothetical protein
MTQRLERAFLEAAKLSDSDQEIFADFLLAELQDEREWNFRFASRPDLLAKLADEAREDHRAGRTENADDLLR